jgi:hypothetical protein
MMNNPPQTKQSKQSKPESRASGQTTDLSEDTVKQIKQAQEILEQQRLEIAKQNIKLQKLEEALISRESKLAENQQLITAQHHQYQALPILVDVNHHKVELKRREEKVKAWEAKAEKYFKEQELANYKAQKSLEQKSIEIKKREEAVAAKESEHGIDISQPWEKLLSLSYKPGKIFVMLGIVSILFLSIKAIQKISTTYSSREDIVETQIATKETIVPNNPQPTISELNKKVRQESKRFMDQKEPIKAVKMQLLTKTEVEEEEITIEEAIESKAKSEAKAEIKPEESLSLTLNRKLFIQPKKKSENTKKIVVNSGLTNLDATANQMDKTSSTTKNNYITKLVNHAQLNSYVDSSPPPHKQQEKKSVSSNLDSDRQKLIKKLFFSAEKNIKANRLSRPANNNALQNISDILKFDPYNIKAEKCKLLIAERYVSMAEISLAMEAYGTMHTYLNQAIAIAPHLESIKRLKKEFDISKRL